MSAVNDNVIRLYQVRPEMALEHLKRTTGLDFDEMPLSLASLANANSPKVSVETKKDINSEPPVLVDVIAGPVVRKNG